MTSEEWVAECLRGVPDTVDFVGRLGEILGIPVKDGSLDGTFSFSAKTRAEAKAKARELKLRLSHLKTDVVQGRQQFNAAFERMKNGLPTAEMKNAIRQIQITGRENYTKLIQTIDSVMLQVNTINES